MKKIPTLFLRDWENEPRYVTRTVNPECEWVIAGEGTASRKYDGTCVMFDGETWWARREVKQGKPEPPGFVALEHDDETGKTVGWEPIGQSAFARWHAEAVTGYEQWPAGTYELLGPRINGNPERFAKHVLLLHATADKIDPPRDFDGLAEWLHAHPYEGIVWHNPDGRMAKIKKRDFPAPARTAWDDMPATGGFGAGRD